MDVKRRGEERGKVRGNVWAHACSRNAQSSCAHYANRYPVQTPPTDRLEYYVSHDDALISVQQHYMHHPNRALLNDPTPQLNARIMIIIDTPFLFCAERNHGCAERNDGNTLITT